MFGTLPDVPPEGEYSIANGARDDDGTFPSLFTLVPTPELGSAAVRSAAKLS